LITVEIMFSIGSHFYFYAEKWELVNFLQNYFQMCNLSFWLSFFLKNQHRVLKCLVSCLRQTFLHSSCSQVGAFFIQSGPIFIQSRPFFIQYGLLHPVQILLFSQAIFIQAGLFSNRKAPYPKCLVRL